MIVLADTDVVLKLAYCGLLLEFLQLLKSPPNEVLVLPALPHMLKRKLATAPAALANAQQFLSRVRIVPGAQVATLARLSSLDPGERQLAALLCDDHRVHQLVTGDKRAIKQMARVATEDQALRDRLASVPVICLEAIMLALLRVRGFTVVNARIAAWRLLPEHPIDASVALAFPPDGDVDHANSSLTSAVAALQTSAPACKLGTC